MNKIKKKCKTCKKIFYSERIVAQYCCLKCYWNSTDKKLKEKMKKHGKNVFGKYAKEYGVWNKGFTKKDFPQLACPGNGKNFTKNKPHWCLGKTKETDAKVKQMAIKTKARIIEMYTTGEIDLSKRKTDCVATGKKISKTISYKIANGLIKPPTYVSGEYFNKKIKTIETYDSSYELIRMKQLDALNIKWTKKHGIHIPYIDVDGKHRHYVPDFLIENKIVEEVKPKNFLKNKTIKLKKRAAISFCKKNKLQYRIVTEKEIFNNG